jgi:hypothetical protein
MPRVQLPDAAFRISASRASCGFERAAGGFAGALGMAPLGGGAITTTGLGGGCLKSVWCGAGTARRLAMEVASTDAGSVVGDGSMGTSWVAAAAVTAADGAVGHSASGVDAYALALGSAPDSGEKRDVRVWPRRTPPTMAAASVPPASTAQILRNPEASPKAVRKTAAGQDALRFGMLEGLMGIAGGGLWAGTDATAGGTVMCDLVSPLL